jgi:hypothetical protein
MHLPRVPPWITNFGSGALDRIRENNVKSHTRILPIFAAALMLAACGDTAQLPEDAAAGPDPILPPPNPTLLPTVAVAPAKGWPDGAQPRPAGDLAVKAFATGLDPRVKPENPEMVA